jgi:regulator of protease activity HflC (stomatin/prohibitin superfamily)
VSTEPIDPNGVPTEAPLVEDGPRRIASARFEVDVEPGSAAALREAMDPANQSLGEALRLSYRLLQVGILALIATFLLSGFQQVQDGSAGVKTLFGAIEGPVGDEALPPGLHPFWPYPVGEIVIVELRRTVDLGDAFWPRYRGGITTLEAATEAADINRHLQPGDDGAVITADGDLGHLRLQAEYVVDDPVSLLRALPPDRLPGVVRRALERGVVAAAARLTLEELTEQREQPVLLIREESQRILDELRCGVRIVSVTAPERIAPLAVRRSFAQVQTSREQAKTAVERARQQVATILTAAAGQVAYSELIRLIGEYESALTLQDRAQADAILDRIGERLGRGDVGGEAAMIVSRAEAMLSSRRARLANEVRRLQGLLPAYRENPRQLVRQLWLEAVREVLDQPESEVFSMPLALASLDLAIESSPEVMQTRRRSDLERRRREADALGFGLSPFSLDSRTIMIDQAGRRLRRDATGGFGRD